ncbi:MAG: class I fructose-bisphosphate aldolase [Thermoguttaceae bacterium]|jgi:fructose-bisphosphate aldolase/2-amino-3,7-dideoxy-D-threo-hept-6-ulosonate synthase
MILTGMGKQLRMRRIFRKGKVLVLPLDHPIYFGPQEGTEDPARLLALARDHGATAVLLTAGALRRAVSEAGDLGIILRIDATLSRMGGPDTIMHLLHSAEEAAALGADMVVLNCYVGMGDAEIEAALLKKLAAVSAECERIGMPLCGEIIPRVRYQDPAQSMPTSADLAVAIRLGLEYGCDVVKTVYNGDPAGYAKAVACGHLPVIMAGGPKTSDELAIFRQLHDAMTHGASGAAIGRRVWGSRRPGDTLDAIRAIVIDGRSAEEAIELYLKEPI